MVEVKEHYDKHLAEIYTWMQGDGKKLQEEFKELLKRDSIEASEVAVAVDLGCGNGVHSQVLGESGYKVVAVDFSRHLLKELKQRCRDLPVEAVEEDILNIAKLTHLKPELIVCMGDTLTHLESREDVMQLIDDCSSVLKDGGHLVLSFRDYTYELKDEARFIDVKSDEKRILTCFLEYSEKTVKVTDLLHEKEGKRWKQKLSTYRKIRITPETVSNIIMSTGMEILRTGTDKGICTIVAEKI